MIAAGRSNSVHNRNPKSRRPRRPPRRSQRRWRASQCLTRWRRSTGGRSLAAQLAAECLSHYGSEVLEKVINKHLIAQECKRRGVTVSRDEVNAEIERLAKRFSLPVDQWLKMLKDERGVNAQQYADDIIWLTLAPGSWPGARPKGRRCRIAGAVAKNKRGGGAVDKRRCGRGGAEDPLVRRPSETSNLPANRYLGGRPYAGAANGLIQPIRRHMPGRSRTPRCGSRKTKSRR